MKLLSGTLLEKLNQEALELLKKDLTFSNQPKSKSTFTSAELWKVHRAKRNFTRRRNITSSF